MATREACRAWLEAQVGTVETGGRDGRSGNVVPYWDQIGRGDLQGYSWCGALLDAMAKACKLALPGSMADTTAGALAFKKAGLWIPVADDPLGRPGDFVFYAWNGRKDWESINHVGWEVQPNVGSFTDIEGNTSPIGDRGESQRNGGMVAKRVRKASFVVGRGRPRYSPPMRPQQVLSVNPYNRHDSLVKWTQWALGVKIDGIPGPITQKALADFRQRLGIKPLYGGYPDSKTQAALALVKRWKKA